MTTEKDAGTHGQVSPVPDTMRAIVQDRYGRPDVLSSCEIPTPPVEDGRVLVKVEASSLNAYDVHMITGRPYMLRAVAGLRTPKHSVPGADLAGVVIAVGSGVTELSAGDRVMGEIGMGAFAEYAAAYPRHLTPIAEGVGFDQAAATPLAGLTALQGLRDVAGLSAGQRVVINGASGGVGTFAVQVAKHLGAEVTAVCSTGKVDMVESIGADRVIDYTKEDFTESERGYDVLFDNAGNRPWRETSRVLADGGINVTTTGPKHAVLGPLRHLVVRKVASRLGDERFTWFTAAVKREDLQYLAQLLETSELDPVIERRYSLDEVPKGLAYLEEGHAHGKLVVTGLHEGSER